MKIALFSRGIQIIGGGERLELNLAKALNATLITPHFNPEIARHFDIDINMKRELEGEYDFYVSVDNPKPILKHSPHLLYMQTTPRYLYDMHDYIASKQNILKRIAFKIYCNTQRTKDREYIEQTEYLACNSNNVRDRIKRYYNREATTIYPPIHTEKYYWKPSEGYWLSVNRIHPWKRIELQIETFKLLPDKRLKIVGELDRSKHIKYNKFIEKLPSNVEMLGKVSENELIELYAKCEGHITTAIDEDFGYTPCEAMASGKPVVAIEEGGYKETIIDGITGILTFPLPKDLANAVKLISKNPHQCRKNCFEQAKLFDYSVFKEKINDLVNETYKKEVM